MSTSYGSVVEIMSDPTAPRLEPLRATLLRRLLFLILVIILVAVGLAILSRRIQTASSMLQVIFSDAVLGLAAGFSARIVFRKQMRLLRLASAFAALLGGLVLLGILTGWQIGIGPLRYGRTSVDWFGLGQLALGMGISLLALQAWHGPDIVIEPSPDQMPGTQPSLPRKPPVRRPRRAIAPGASPRRRGRTVQSAAPITVERPLKPKHRRIYRRKPQLQLATEVEHRCPYCLELVEPNDPRGTVECKVCHTLHHADCWAITGTCQVPHYTV